MKKIAVIGSINMDLMAFADRIPGRGETVSAGGFRYAPGGKGANQAVAAARLGGDVTMFGCVGDDTFGEQVLKNLQHNGIHTDHVECKMGESSGLALIVTASGDNVITVVPGANLSVSKVYIDAHWDEIARHDIFLLQNEITAETVEYAMHKLAVLGKTIIYNPAPARSISRTALDCVAFLTPNEHEAQSILPEGNWKEKLCQEYSDRLIVTMGSRGVITAQEGKVLTIPACPARVMDTTGAGDTFNGAFAYGLSVDMCFEKAILFANTAAGLSTEKVGAQDGMPTYQAVIERLSAAIHERKE